MSIEMYEIVGLYTWHWRRVGQAKTLCGHDTSNMEVIIEANKDEVECKICIKKVKEVMKPQ